MENGLGATAAKFGATLAVLQQGQQVFGFGIVARSGETVKGGFHHYHMSSSGRSLATPSSPQSLSADSNGPRERWRGISSSRARWGFNAWPKSMSITETWF